MTDTQLKDSACQLLTENILRFWEEQMFDPNGGFYGRMTGNGVLDTHAERGVVLNARILWTFSAAYRILHDPRYFKMATHAKDYFLSHFVDQQFGGVFWSVSADGKPLSTKKQTYAISFAIYALSEYARAAADTHAVNMAIRLYEDIEQYAFDPVHVGYAEALTRQWQPIADMRLSDKDEYATRTMNTHLHVMEAYTNLYRIWPDPKLKQSIQTLLNIFAQKLYNPTNGHIDLFFNDTWQGKRNIASYGHDIEAAWLLNEALQVIGDADMQQSMQPIIEHIARASQEGDPRYRQLALQTYDYILQYLVDYAHGEWFWAILPDGSIDKENDKAGLWKCPYHNSRMCFEIIERL